jgi:hypothetical protein
MVEMRRWLVISVLAACSYEPARTADVLGADAAVEPGVDAPAQPVVCPARYDIKSGGHSYHSTNSLNYDAAVAECGLDGGTLMKIDSMDENMELYTRLNDAFGVRVWIGLRDSNNDGVYEWADGSIPAFENWDVKPGSGAEDDCVYVGGDNFAYQDRGKWFTDTCDNGRIAVCECAGN